jgi:hypothetical protein
MTGIETEQDFACRVGVLLRKDLNYFLYRHKNIEKSRLWVSFLKGSKNGIFATSY